MEAELKNSSLHCRTCLAQLGNMNTTPASEIVQINAQLKLWISNCTGIDLAQEQDVHSQTMCHECYTTVRTANEFQDKILQAEKHLLRVNDSHMLISCCICMRQYPRTVKSLMCQVSEAPYLQDWIEGSSSSAQLLRNEWLQQSVCRFCYGKLRDCYEWRLAAEESAEYLKSLFTNNSWHCYSNFEAAMPEQVPPLQMKQECVDNFNSLPGDYEQYNIFHDQYGNVPAMACTIKLEDQQQDTYPVYQDYQDYGCSPQVADFMEPFECNTNPKYDTHYCKSCGTSFTSNYLYENHICPSVNTQSSQLDIRKPAKVRANVFKKVCNQCQKRFNKAFLLEAHILQVHQGKRKPFLCKFCTHKSYLTNTHLQRHMKTAHREAWLRSRDDHNQFTCCDL